MKQSQVTDEMRAQICAELPELAEIKDAGLRNKVVEAWAYSLSLSCFKKISELPPSGGPHELLAPRGNQTDHLRGVARIALHIAEEMKGIYPDLPINRDVLIAGGLVHDVGKPYEFDPSNQKRWKDTPRISGYPSTRHSIHGWHVCLSVGLPEEVAHVAGSHSKEGGFITRSLEATIIHFADHVYWNALKAGGMIQETF